MFQSFSDIGKFYGQEEWVECHDFPSEIFCLTVPKKIVHESFSVSLVLVSEIFMH